jgi:hypothetical protein
VTVKLMAVRTVAVVVVAEVNWGTAVTTSDTAEEDPVKFGSAPYVAAIVWLPVVAKLVVQVARPPETTWLVQGVIEEPLSVKFTDPVRVPDPEVSVTVAV